MSQSVQVREIENGLLVSMTEETQNWRTREWYAKTRQEAQKYVMALIAGKKP